MRKSNGIPPGKTRKIYLDYASSALSKSANPGAIHELGVREKNKLEGARTAVAEVLKARNKEIIFTSGATESNNLAILGLMRNLEQRPGLPHIITTNIEHASVLEVCKYLERTKKAEVTYVGVEQSGIIDPKKIRKALKKNTVLVSVMYANNEIGTIQPIREIAKEIRHFKKTKSVNFFQVLGSPRPARPDHSKNLLTSFSFPVFHTDAVQAVNYSPINVRELGVDLMSMNSVKIYGPKGVGVLFVKENTPIGPIMFGGNQEFGLRPGTENVALAIEFAKALRTTEKLKKEEVKRLTKLKDYFFSQLRKKISAQFIINGDLKNRLPNNINITIPHIPSDLLVIELSEREIMASSKSACKAGDGKASQVIKAINKNLKETDGSLRFSLGRQTTKKDIDYTVESLSEILAKLKKWYLT